MYGYVTNIERHKLEDGSAAVIPSGPWARSRPGTCASSGRCTAGCLGWVSMHGAVLRSRRSESG
jgi:hypothetical protein